MGLFDKMKDTATQAMSDAKQAVAKTRADMVAESRDAEPTTVVTAGPQPLYEAVSHIDGKNATVRLWPDRIEWERKRGVSGAKVTAGVMTAGLSMLATGVKGGKDAYDMVLLEHITNVSNRKDGMLYHLVEVQTASGGAINTIAFRVSRDEAAQFRQAILSAIQEHKAGSSTQVNVNVAQQTTTAAPAAPDAAAQLQQLAGLRDAGILSEAEFEAKKTEILARM
ncbi:SHOCT domain-containing protein [Leucobacter tenebrionis]|uniref:SHOCT domain-containing protein n=1 Tax=Leucobacter tenebrionis TaxID=2873270 RepID=UPI002106F843|nr:SHOCT domain-containing protein [Leucobacter tenebrionis]